MTIKIKCRSTKNLEIAQHEPLGGGFSPPAVAALHRNSKVARAGLDRTKYTSPRPISYMAHHSQRISLGIVKADSSAIHTRSASTSRLSLSSSPAPWARDVSARTVYCTGPSGQE